jgi:hypothetical protein
MEQSPAFICHELVLRLANTLSSTLALSLSLACKKTRNQSEICAQLTALYPGLSGTNRRGMKKPFSPIT